MEYVEKELIKVEHLLRKLCDEREQEEGAARRTSRQLQDINEERLHYRKTYLENQALAIQYSEKLDSLRDVLQNMKSFVSTSIETLEQQ